MENNLPQTKQTDLGGFTDPNFIRAFQDLSEYIVKFNVTEKAGELAESLDKAIAASKAELAANQELDDHYQKALVKLKFIAFPLLDDEDNIDLIKNHFTRQFDFPDYDITEKLSGKLLNILIAEDRDKFKADLKTALLGNNEKITSRAEIKTIADWLKNYNAKLGIGIVDNLKRVEYMVGLTKVKGLDERYLNRLKVLFNFYEAIKLSSLTPAGFDEEVSIMVDGKLQIFRRGVLEPVREIKVPGLTIEKKFVSPAKSEIDNNLAELKQLAASYPSGSLEKKAVEEEIEKVRSKK